MSNPSAIFDLAYRGELEELKTAMSSYNEQCVEDSFKGSTPLHWACLGGQLDVARWLVAQGSVDPQKLNQDGRSALFFACEGCNLSTVIWLVEECTADPNARDIVDGQTPLHRVCCAGIVRGVDNAVPTIQYLLTQGKADPSVTDNGGHLPEEPMEKVSSVMWKGKHLDIDHMLKVARGEASDTITDLKVPSKAPRSSYGSNEANGESAVAPSVQMSTPLHVNSNGTKNVGLPPSDDATTTQSESQERRPKATTPLEETTTSSSNEGGAPLASPQSRPSRVNAMKHAFENRKSTSSEGRKSTSSEGSPPKERRSSGTTAFMNKLKMFGGKK